MKLDDEANLNQHTNKIYTLQHEIETNLESARGDTRSQEVNFQQHGVRGSKG